MTIGLSMMNMLDPVSNQQVSIVSRFFGILALLLFFVVNAHHALLWVLLSSFDAIPIGSLTPAGLSLPVLIGTVGDVFVLGVGIAAPILAVMLVIELALGLVVRTVPQMNVFIIAFPLKIGVGLLLLVVTMPILARLLVSAFGTIATGVGSVLHGM